MNKYIVIPDINDKAAHHIVEMPKNFFIKAKACDDGVAVVIDDKDTEDIYGITIPCDEEYFPVLRRAIAMGNAEDIEEQVLGNVEMLVLNFLEDDETILEIPNNMEHLCVELNSFLRSLRDASRKRFDLKKDKRQKSTPK